MEMLRANRRELGLVEEGDDVFVTRSANSYPNRFPAQRKQCKKTISERLTSWKYGAWWLQLSEL
jgi:hypothetical protein